MTRGGDEATPIEAVLDDIEDDRRRRTGRLRCCPSLAVRGYHLRATNAGVPLTPATSDQLPAGPGLSELWLR